MNIVMAADVSPLDAASGAERVLHHHARCLARRGHRVQVVFRVAAGSEVPREWAGCRLWPYRVARSGPLAFARSTLREGGAALRAAFDATPPDVVNVHQPHSGLVTLLRSPAPRPPFVYTFLSPAPAEHARQASDRGTDRGAWRPWHRWLVPAALRLVEGAVLRRAAAVTVLSAFMRDELTEWHPRCRGSDVHLVPGGVDVQRFTPAADRRGLRSRLGYEDGRALLLTVRNLEPRTGVETLLRAVAELAARRRDFLLLVAGRGPLMQPLRALAGSLGVDPLVRFLGFVDDERLVDLYRVADVYVQPDTDLQGFGLPIVEAMACATPVLATPIGGALDILQPFDPRYLLAGIDPSAVAAGIDAGLDDDAFLSSGTAARGYVERHYAWDVVVSRAEAVFEAVVAETGARGAR